MASVNTIRIIRFFEDAAEKEYIREFFRFVGCIVFDSLIDEWLDARWEQNLQPDSEECGVEVVLNYYGNDPYLEECAQNGIRRVYLYFSMDDKIAYCSENPLAANKKKWLLAAKNKPEDRTHFKSKYFARKKAVKRLIDTIWNGNVAQKNALNHIYNRYTKISLPILPPLPPNVDMFYLLQAKRSLRVLNMGEVLEEPTAKISHIPIQNYIGNILTELTRFYIGLNATNRKDVYTVYAKVNAANMIREVERLLFESDKNKIPFHLATEDDLIRELLSVQNKEPEFLSIYLLMANVYQLNWRQNPIQEELYMRVLRSLPENSRRAGFVWYRLGLYYEKNNNLNKAMSCYQKSVQTDRMCYMAWYKLGYHSAREKQYETAEQYLTQMIKVIFHGRSTSPEEDGEYPDWSHINLKELQYTYKSYITRAKIWIIKKGEFSTRALIGKACLAVSKYEDPDIIFKIADPPTTNTNDRQAYQAYLTYHRTSAPVWAMWQVLRPWSEKIIKDSFVRFVVENRLAQWK